MASSTTPPNSPTTWSPATSPDPAGTSHQLTPPAPDHAHSDPSLCQVVLRRGCWGALNLARDSGGWAGIGLVLGPGVAQSEVPGFRVSPAALDVRVVP